MSPRPGRCASCELEFSGRPISARGLEFCCLGCVEAGPCVCSYEADLAEDGVDRLGLLVVVQPAPASATAADRDAAAQSVDESPVLAA